MHLPALNTPQFDTVRTRLPHQAQPVPPIYQPEVAAAAIVDAARRPRRERWVGGSTVATIVGNRLAPGLADRYLARTGYDAQQTDEPVPHPRPDNLFEPVPGDHGAHGRFDGDANEHSAQSWAARHRVRFRAARGARRRDRSGGLARRRRRGHGDPAAGVK